MRCPTGVAQLIFFMPVCFRSMNLLSCLCYFCKIIDLDDMEGIIHTMNRWIQQVGLSENISKLLIYIGLILAILIVAYLIDRICKKILVPIVKRITAKTDFKWDDYLWNDDVLNDLCRLITPIIIYSLIPLVLPDDSLLGFMLKICQVYIMAVIMILLCSVITSLYTMTNEDDKLKNHSLKGFYQMLKLAVICLGTIIIISTKSI